MESLFSTDDVHPRDRFALWHDVACKTLIPHDSRPDDRPLFTASLAAGQVQDLGFFVCETAAMTVERTPRQIKQIESDDIFICHQLTGTLGFSQSDNDVMLNAGDMTLLDPLVPYSGRFSADCRLLVLKIPRRQLETRIGNSRGFLLDKLAAEEPDTAFTGDMLHTLLWQVDSLSDEAQQIVQQQLLDLIALSLLRGGSNARLSSAPGIALLRLRSAIDAMLTTTDLAVADIAKAAGISVRYAHALLATQGTSTKRLVTERRLQKCRQALADPGQANRSISEIAYAWGFADVSHFGRCFKAAYGMTPSQFRNEPGAA